MRYFKYFILFLTVQVIFHIVATSLSDNSSTDFCFLSLCTSGDEQPVLSAIFRFGWFLHGIIFLWIFAYNKIVSLIGYGISGSLFILTLGELSGFKFDLFLIFTGGGLLSLLYYTFLPQRLTKEGYSVWLVLSFCTYIILFPFAWLIRFLTNVEGEITETWSFVLVFMSIISVIAATIIPVALFSPPHKQSKADELIKSNARKKELDRPVLDWVVSLIYFLTLFFNKQYIEEMSPLSIFYPVFVFWFIVYPMLRKKSRLVKSIVFTVYTVSFLLAFDALIYQIYQLVNREGEGVIIISDYIIVMIYVCFYPIFKTIPEYYLISKSKGKKFGQVYKSGFTSELIILLYILVKINLNYYDF